MIKTVCLNSGALLLTGGIGVATALSTTSPIHAQHAPESIHTIQAQAVRCGRASQRIDWSRYYTVYEPQRCYFEWGRVDKFRLFEGSALGATELASIASFLNQGINLCRLPSIPRRSLAGHQLATTLADVYDFGEQLNFFEFAWLANLLLIADSFERNTSVAPTVSELTDNSLRAKYAGYVVPDIRSGFYNFHDVIVAAVAGALNNPDGYNEMVQDALGDSQCWPAMGFYWSFFSDEFNRQYGQEVTLPSGQIVSHATLSVDEALYYFWRVQNNLSGLRDLNGSPLVRRRGAQTYNTVYESVYNQILPADREEFIERIKWILERVSILQVYYLQGAAKTEFEHRFQRTYELRDK